MHIFRPSLPLGLLLDPSSECSPALYTTAEMEKESTRLTIHTDLCRSATDHVPRQKI